jgi:hypothetical protein
VQIADVVAAPRAPKEMEKDAAHYLELAGRHRDALAASLWQPESTATLRAQSIAFVGAREAQGQARGAKIAATHGEKRAIADGALLRDRLVAALRLLKKTRVIAVDRHVLPVANTARNAGALLCWMRNARPEVEKAREPLRSCLGADPVAMLDGLCARLRSAREERRTTDAAAEAATLAVRHAGMFVEGSIRLLLDAARLAFRGDPRQLRQFRRESSRRRALRRRARAPL